MMVLAEGQVMEEVDSIVIPDELMTDEEVNKSNEEVFLDEGQNDKTVDLNVVENSEEAEETFIEKKNDWGIEINDSSDESDDEIKDIIQEESIETHVGGSSKTSEYGKDFIKSFESFRDHAYKAVPTEKYYTIGYGHYGADVYEGMTITIEEAEIMFEEDLLKYENYVDTFLNNYGISVNQSQYDALVSFTYNVGNQWKATETFQLKTYLINGVSNYTDEQITTAFTNWNKSGGKVLAGLTRRRKAEAEMFLHGNIANIESGWIDVSPGTANKYTQIWWDAGKNATSYDVKIWKGTLWEGDAYQILWGVTGTSCEINLPRGYYEGYVDYRNGDDVRISRNTISFTVDSDYAPKPNKAKLGKCFN